MSLFPDDDNMLLARFESMLKSNSICFFDSLEYEKIIRNYLILGRNSFAKRALILGLKQYPDSVFLKLLKVEFLIFDNKFDTALKLLNQLEQIEPENEEIFIYKSNIFSNQGFHEKAIQALEKALIITENSSDIYELIGLEYKYLEKYDKARFCFSQCLEFDEEDYSSLFNLVYCYDMQQKHTEAIDFLNKLIDSNPYNEELWHQLGLQFVHIEKYEDALKSFDYAILIDEYFIAPYLEKAKILERLKKYEKAIKNYKTSLELADPTAFVYFRIGSCYEKIEDISKSIRYFKKSVHEDPLLDKAWHRLAEIVYEQKNYDKGLYYINKALYIDENKSFYWRLYSQIALKLNLFEESIKGLEKCILLEDFDVSIWVGLADVLHFLGDFDDSIKHLIKGDLVFEESAEINYRLAGLYLTQNQLNKGIEKLKYALKINFDKRIILKELFPTIYKMTLVKDIIENIDNISL